MLSEIVDNRDRSSSPFNLSSLITCRRFHHEITMFTGTMKIQICEAVGLRAIDEQQKFSQDEPMLDPYVQLDVDKNHLDRSSTKSKTFDPVWNESFTIEVQNAVMLGITVFHDAALPPDYFVANCTIPFEELINRDGKTDFWVSCLFYLSLS